VTIPEGWGSSLASRLEPVFGPEDRLKPGRQPGPEWSREVAR